ncbi:hypothetical protein IJ732_07945 [bacterium]|nr:hypothetical protein [bacterium]
MKRILILSFLILSLQNVTYGSTMKCSTKGTITSCYVNGKNIVNVQNLQNGYAIVQTDVGLGMGMFAQISKMTLFEAKAYIDTMKELVTMEGKLIEEKIKKEKIKKQEELRLEKIKKANEKIITKKVSIVSSNGINITLEEDKNNDDFLIINSQKIKVGSNLVNGKPTTQYTSSIYERAKQIRMEAANNNRLPKPYAEIISGLDCNPLFKIVYNLRDQYNISYEDALKLMIFRKDNSDFRAEDLLIPEEISKREYNKLLNEAEFQLSNITFPKF